jgi:hypothetical protein
MAAGKPAGLRCSQLTSDNRCHLFGRTERPPVCRNLRASEDMCGSSAEEALERLSGWEQLTRPE